MTNKHKMSEEKLIEAIGKCKSIKEANELIGHE